LSEVEENPTKAEMEGDAGRISEDDSGRMSEGLGAEEAEELNGIAEELNVSETEDESSGIEKGIDENDDVEEETGSGDNEEEDNETMRTIFIKGIDYDLTEEALREEMEKIGEVVRVKIPMTKEESRNKGFGYVEFKKLVSAQKALKLNGTQLLGRQVTIDKATPRDSSSKLFTIFVRNLSFDTTREEIEEHFEKYGNIKNVTVPVDKENESRNRGFAFVEFTDREVVNKVMNDRHAIGNRTIYLKEGKKDERRGGDRFNDRRGGDRYDDDRRGGDRFNDRRGGDRGGFNDRYNDRGGGFRRNDEGRGGFRDNRRERRDRDD